MCVNIFTLRLYYLHSHLFSLGFFILSLDIFFILDPYLDEPG